MTDKINKNSDKVVNMRVAKVEPAQVIENWLQGTEKKKVKSKTKVKVVVDPNTKLPDRKTSGAAGYDVYANVKLPTWIKPGETKLIPTGLKMKLPEGVMAEVRPRSGLALKNSITILNSPGTVDSDYIDEIGIILINHGTNNFEVRKGDRIAQLVFTRYEVVDFLETKELTPTDRKGGFGSTGK